MSPRGGARKNSGRAKKNRTEAFTVRVHPYGLAEAKKAAKSIGWSWTDFVYSALCAKTEEVKALPTDEKKRQRRLKKLFAELDEAMKRDDDATIDRLDAELNELEPEEDD